MTSGRASDQVVWITGGGSGLGRAMALEFARLGADVAVSGRRADRLEEVAAAARALGRRALAIPCDVTDDADVARAAAAVVAGLGRLDTAVVNAGFSVMGRFESLSDADLRRQFDTNVFGAASTIRHALPALRASRGRLALVCSVAGMIATPKGSAYAASKYALRALGQTLAIELHGSGVSCTTIYPGMVASEIAQVDNEGRFSPDRQDRRPSRLIWPTERAAKVMVAAILRREREFTFTGHGRLGAWLGKHVPGLVHLLMTRRRS